MHTTTLGNLDDFGLAELQADEARQIDGGWHPVVWSLIAATAVAIIDNVDSFVDGFRDGYAAASG